MRGPVADLSTRALAGLLLIMTFAVGVLGGVVLDRTFVLSSARIAPPAPPPVAAREAVRSVAQEEAAEARAFIQWMVRELDLGAEQRRQVDSILAGQRSAIREVSQELRLRYQAIIKEARAEIRGVLTEEQDDRLRALMDSTGQEAHTGEERR